MGLPLFVAPVESDVSRKRSKTPSTSPPRTNIRRSNNHERPSSARTARLIEQIQSRRPLPRTVADALNSENVSTELVSSSEYILHISSDDDPDRPRPQRLLRMGQRFGNEWRERDWENAQQDVDGEWWIVEHRLWGGRARLTRLGPELSRLRPTSRSPPNAQQQAETQAQVARAHRRIANSSRVSPLSLPWNTNVVPWSPEPSRRDRNDANGLGDRMRSVSPEGWDTLLTTLTPDPQPPSANSSFVSTAATQNANTSSSSTSLSEPPRPVEPPLSHTPDQPCEPGQENSTGEDDENSSTRATNRGPTRAMNPVRFNVPDYNTEGPSDGNATQRTGDSQDRPLRVLPLPRPASVTRQERDSLVAHLSAGGWDLTTGTRRRRNQEASAASGNTGPAVDEEMTGWQRIVRGLAVRDDIPDEWWAEAGLSRTLTRDRL